MLKPKFYLFFVFVACFTACQNTPPAATGDFAMGLTFDEAAYAKIPKKASLTRGLYDNLPNAVTLEAFCPAIGDQKKKQTCVGWSSAYYARTILWAREHNLSNQAEITDNSFAASFTYRAASMVMENVDMDCSLGSNIPIALEIMRKYGAMPTRYFKDECYAGELSNDIVAKANPFRIQSFTRILDKSDPEAMQIKKIQKSLSEGNPVVIGMSVIRSFGRCRSEVWEVTGDQEVLGGHALCVIGYDNNKAGGAFQIINSWGTGWGNNGFVWVKYADFLHYTHEACEMVVNIRRPEPPKPEPIAPEPVKPEPVKPAPEPEPQPAPVAQKEHLSGSLQLVLDSGSEIAMTAQTVGGMDVVPANNDKPKPPAPKPNNPLMPTNTSGYFAYKTAQAYSSGTRFRIYLNNNEPAFVYAFSLDNTRRFSQLFPYASNISAALNYSKNTVALPDEDHYIQLDNQKGTDVLCILYAKEELDINQIQSAMQGSKGSFFEMLYAALGDKLIQGNHIQYNPNNINFKAELDNGFIVPIIVEFTHN
ncbi:MAG: hypothetical protein RI894_113 [Bacteroidota bacterium]|jgi:hypothetical protein